MQVIVVGDVPLIVVLYRHQKVNQSPLLNLEVFAEFTLLEAEQYLKIVVVGKTQGECLLTHKLDVDIVNCVVVTTTTTMTRQ